jgi:hypothetical protein
MVHRIGIIAEDMSDVEVIKVLAKKISGKAVSADQHVGKGCGPLKKKAMGWCKSLLTKGCTIILMVHDRDRNDAAALRRQLESVLAGAPQAIKIVIIPEEELEAWLLSDTDAINKAMKLKKGLKVVHHPETVPSPKEYIRDQTYLRSNKKVQYVNSVHNKIIASEIDISLIELRCPSFAPFQDFFAKKTRTQKR